MIIVTNRVEVVPDRMSEAMDWAERVIEALDKADLGASKGWLLRTVTGNVYRLSFAGQYADMGEFEELMNKRGADPGFKALIKERAEAGWHVATERIISQIVKEI